MPITRNRRIHRHLQDCHEPDPEYFERETEYRQERDKSNSGSVDSLFGYLNTPKTRKETG